MVIGAALSIVALALLVEIALLMRVFFIYFFKKFEKTHMGLHFSLQHKYTT